MRERPKVSVVTICFNCENEIERTIVSVLNQSHEHFEYLIIDGASTDNTMEIVNSYRVKFDQKHINFIVVSEKDNGIYNAMNKGIELANGEWINFMNAGDTFFDHDVLKKIFSSEYEADVICGVSLLEAEGKRKEWRPAKFDSMWKTMPFNHQSTFVRLQYHKERLFDESFKLCGDYDFFFESYLLLHKKFVAITNYVAIYDINGTSSANQLQVAKENIKIALKYKSFQSYTYFVLRYIKRLLTKENSFFHE